MKRCTICDKELPKSSFELIADGIRYRKRCINCNLKLAKEKELRNTPKAVAIRNKEYRIRYKLIIFRHYGGSSPKCACCNEGNMEFLTIDHINGGGNEHRRSLGFPDGSGSGSPFYRWLINNNFPTGFRVLCQNCNASLGHFGYCPHGMKRESTPEEIERAVRS